MLDLELPREVTHCTRVSRGVAVAFGYAAPMSALTGVHQWLCNRSMTMN